VTQPGTLIGSADMLDVAVTCNVPGSFALIAPTADQRYASSTATLLPDGKVLLAGGLKFPTNEVLRTAEIYDPVGKRMIVFGGTDNHMLYDDTWALALEGPPAWSRIEAVAPSSLVRLYHSAVYDPAAIGWWSGGVATMGCT